jgi:hypothetical protein
MGLMRQKTNEKATAIDRLSPKVSRTDKAADERQTINKARNLRTPKTAALSVSA